MFPKTQQAASDLAATLHGVVFNAIPRIESAVIVDVTNYNTLGYVIASSGRGQVQVFGVPLAAVSRGARIYITSAGPEKNQRYIYTATANACIPAGTSGAIMQVRPTPVNTISNNANNSFPSFPGTPKPQVALSGKQFTAQGGLGYYWSFFLNFAALPTSSFCVFDFQAHQTVPGFLLGEGIRCTVEPDGTIILHSYGDFYSSGPNDYESYHSTQSLTPGTTHYIVWQIVGSGGNGQALTIDGYSTTGNGQPIWNTNGASPFSFISMDIPYDVTFFNAFTQSLPAPAGTWLSKFQFGVSLNGGVVQAPIHGVPTTDSQIPNGRQVYNQGLRTLSSWLNQYSTDFAAASALGQIPVSYPDSGLEANYLTFDGYYITGKSAGPY